MGDTPFMVKSHDVRLDADIASGCKTSNGDIKAHS